MMMRVVLFLSLLVAAWLPVCAQDLSQSTVIRDPEPIAGSPKHALTGVGPDSRGLSGVYEGEAAVITVSGINEAWEVNCVGPANNTATYLSATPFNGERPMNGMTYNCTTGKKRTTDIYRVSFTKKKKNLQCTEYDEPIIAEYDSKGKYLDLRGSQFEFYYTPPELFMCMAMMRTEDCGMFAGPYPKK